MALSAFISLIQYAIPAWLLLFFAVILMKMLRGDINTNGLLKSWQGGPTDPERAAIMALTIFAAGYYLISSINTGVQANPQSGSPTMPDVPDGILVLLGGANGIYISGKIIRPRN